MPAMQIRVTDEELALAKRLAGEDGRETVSSLVRRLLANEALRRRAASALGIRATGEHA